MKIYRLEYEYRISEEFPHLNCGAYNGNGTRELVEMIGEYYYSHDHPIPDEDCYLKGVWYDIPSRERDNYHFAFRSITQLKEWFYNEICADQMVGVARVAVYEVEANKVQFGAYQIIVDANDMVFVEAYKPNFYFI